MWRAVGLVVGAVVLGASWSGARGRPQSAPGTVPPPVVRVPTIVLDPGHGGEDPGAIGSSGTEEKAVALSAARHFRDVLGGRGYRVVLTRDEDVLRSLDARAAAANVVRPDLFISLHVNFAPSAQTRGPEVGWRPAGAGRTSAEDLGSPRPGSRFALVPWHDAHERHTDRSAAAAARLGTALEAAGPLGPRGVHRAALRGLSAVDAPAVLVELGYLSNAAEEAALSTDDGLLYLASLLADGLDSLVERRR
jgi:N-acetylmuramoyl-L-alanine amidase